MTGSQLIDDWKDSDEKDSFYAKRLKLVYRWLNESQLQHINKSEILRGTWTPTITSTGTIALPADFLREYPDLVQKTSGVTNDILLKVDYQDAVNMSFSGLVAYSIFGSNFYVWSAQAATPKIPYIKKPTVITTANIEVADLEIPTEYHGTLLINMEALWAKSKGDYAGYLSLKTEFERRAFNDGLKFNQRTTNPPRMR